MWIDDIKTALENLNGFAHYSEINSEIEKLRDNLSKNWMAVVRRTIQQHSSDSQSWLGKEDLFYSVDGIGKGVWGLRNYFPKNYHTDITINETNEPADRADYNIQRIIRNTSLSAQIKEFHNNRCQICRTEIKIGVDILYSEGHHIKPLGNPHNGPDSSDNILVVCPNCHIKCDYNIISLDIKSLETKGRKLNQDYIDYHNNLFDEKS